MKSLLFFLSLLVTAPLMAATSKQCPGEEGYYYTNDRSSRNPSEGGFISHDADVSDDIWVGKNAAICGFASVTNGVRVLGRAVVCDDAEVKGAKVRISGHARICGDAQVDGRKQDLVFKGYYVAETGSFSQGSYNSKKAEKKQSKKDVVQVLVKALNKHSSTDYSFTDDGTRKVRFDNEYKAEMDDLNNPCEIVLTETIERKALRNKHYSTTPYTRVTARVNLSEINLRNVSQPKSMDTRDRDGSKIYQISFDRSASGDLYVYEYEKKLDDDKDSFYEKGYTTISGMWLYSDSKADLQGLHQYFSAAITACSAQ